MFSRNAWPVALAMLAMCACGTAAASAEIARPPGANPENRGYELVSLPDAFGTRFILGSGPSLLQRPALAPTGGAAIVQSDGGRGGPVPNQPERGGVTPLRAVRQPSGAWTHSFASGPHQPDGESDAIVDWTPDFSTVLWRMDVPETAQGTGLALSADGRTVTFTRDLAPEPGLDPPEYRVVQRTNGGPDRPVSVSSNGTPLENPLLARVSDDATRVAFNAGDSATSRLYLRDNSTTTEVDAAEQPLANRTHSEYVGGSADLGTILFVTRDRLVPADTDDDADLYRRTGGGALNLVSRGSGGGGNGSGGDCAASLPSTQAGGSAQGCDIAFVGASPDGQLAYFLSPEQLDGASDAEAGGANLYVRRGNQAIRYVLTLDPSDTELQSRGPTSSGVGSDYFRRDAGVEGDGSLLVRTVRNPSSATPYGATQILHVDPQTAAATCVSCAPGGGASDIEAVLTSLVDGIVSDPPKRNATADGRHVFFDTAARLVPEDRNSAVDVYSYDVATGVRTLVSDGTTGHDSIFGGVSDDGADVLFLTDDTLVGLDQNGNFLKVYDARRGGGQEAPSTPSTVPACLDDACKPAAPGLPSLVPPASTFSTPGTGNVGRGTTVRLAVGAISAAQRRALARTGRVTLRVRTSAAATVRISGRAKVGRSTVTVASGSVRLSKAGTKTVALRLSPNARRALASRGSLHVSFTATVAGSSTKKTVRVSLRATTNEKAGSR